MSKPPAGEHIENVGISFTGYRRPAFVAAVDRGYTSVIVRRAGRPASRGETLAEKLEHAEACLGDVLLRQRILGARLIEMADVLARSPAPSSRDTKSAKRCLGAALAIIDTVDQQTGLVL